MREVMARSRRVEEENVELRTVNAQLRAELLGLQTRCTSMRAHLDRLASFARSIDA